MVGADALFFVFSKLFFVSKIPAVADDAFLPLFVLVTRHITIPSIFIPSITSIFRKRTPLVVAPAQF